MAMFPCDFGSHRYQGRQQTAFVHLVDGGNDLGRKLRMCPTHFDQLVEYLMLNTLCTRIGDDFVVFDDDDSSPICLECKCENPTRMLFAHTFSSTFPRRAFWGRVCEGCTGDVLERLKIAP